MPSMDNGRRYMTNRFCKQSGTKTLGYAQMAPNSFPTQLDRASFDEMFQTADLATLSHTAN